MLCLANNHIFDHGPQGLENTLAVCAKAGVSTVGAGANLAAARQILVTKVDDFVSAYWRWPSTSFRSPLGPQQEPTLST